MIIKKAVVILCIFLLVFPSSLTFANENNQKEITHSYIVGLNEDVVEEDFIEKKLKDKKIKKIKTKKNNLIVTDLNLTEYAEIVFDDEVLFVEENAVVQMTLINKVNKKELNNSEQIMPWGLVSIGAETALENGDDGKNINIAVLDTGISEHPDLEIKGGISFVEDTDAYQDDNGHGTHVAGTIAALNNEFGVVGIAPASNIYAVKVLDNEGNGSYAQVIEGIQWAMDNKMDIISMSFGGEIYSQALHEAIQEATDAGILVIAAGGNLGLGEETLIFPAGFPESISVGAVDENLERAEYSSTGSELDLVAPGTSILSTLNDDTYGEMSGTSMAVPHVTGVAAVVWANHKKLTSEDVMNQLFTSAVSLGDTNEYGHGLVTIQEDFQDRQESNEIDDEIIEEEPLNDVEEQENLLNDLEETETLNLNQMNSSAVTLTHNEMKNNNISGWNHTVGLKSDGSVVAVGRNDFGQLGVGDWRNIVEVSAGQKHTVGLKMDGNVVAVGDDNSGQLGIEGWTDIVEVSTGIYNTLGIKSDGSVVAVGWNNVGQLEVESWTDIVEVSAGYSHTVGLKNDGSVVAVGYNSDGQLEIESWTDIVEVSARGFHTVGLKSDGSVVAVGRDDYGQLGVDGWTDIIEVSTGYYHTLGVRSDGSVVAVGRDDYGQLGVDGWTDIVEVTGGIYYTVGLKSDGSIVAVGRDNYGQLGVDGWTDIKTPSINGVDNTPDTAPEIIFSSISSSDGGDLAGEGSTVELTIGLNEGIVKDPYITILGKPTNISYTRHSLVASVTVTKDDPIGEIEFSIQGLEDYSGNISEPITFTTAMDGTKVTRVIDTDLILMTEPLGYSEDFILEKAQEVLIPLLQERDIRLGLSVDTLGGFVQNPVSASTTVTNDYYTTSGDQGTYGVSIGFKAIPAINTIMLDHMDLTEKVTGFNLSTNKLTMEVNAIDSEGNIVPLYTEIVCDANNDNLEDDRYKCSDNKYIKFTQTQYSRWGDMIVYDNPDELRLYSIGFIAEAYDSRELTNQETDNFISDEYIYEYIFDQEDMSYKESIQNNLSVDVMTDDINYYYTIGGERSSISISGRASFTLIPEGNLIYQPFVSYYKEGSHLEYMMPYYRINGLNVRVHTQDSNNNEARYTKKIAASGGGSVDQVISYVNIEDDLTVESISPYIDGKRCETIVFSEAEECNNKTNLYNEATGVRMQDDDAIYKGAPDLKYLDYEMNLNNVEGSFYGLILNNNVNTSFMMEGMDSANFDFIGIGNEGNKSSIQSLIDYNNGIGTYIDNSDMDAVMRNLADYIIEKHYGINQPMNLQALASDSKVDLTWDIVETAESYNVKRSSTLEGPYEAIADNILSPYFSDTTVVNGNSYYYVVTSISNIGESPNSNSVHVILNNLPTLNITSHSDGQQLTENIITFQWDYSDIDTETQLAYQVIGSQDNWETWVYFSETISSPLTTHTTPQLAGGEWDFGIQVYDGTDWSGWSYVNDLLLPISYEPNDDVTTAYPIAYHSFFSSTISSENDSDFYKYIPSGTGVDTISFQSPENAKYNLYVYDINMNLLNGILASELYYLVESGQTYYIKVFSADGSFSEEPYSFTVSPLELNIETQYQYDENGNLTNKQTTIQN
ncbi:S8 family serine peptidase [Chengkuizengella sediminis]|uniref:S8 family serine peptidase n=1 Tax=Chengkuizengella sediminis TaxID=1885917 RepID=UPI001389B133|nr:S8 family serine peptidase [Chengkuizengella sediminis]NDI37234.1 S8 family serine peptidase [Chengkuizengella sediminis]